MTKTHLVIGDAHTHDGDDFSRFMWLGKFIVDKKPDEIIIMGDWWDMFSINRFDTPGSLEKEGARVLLDLEAGQEAFDILFTPLAGHNMERKRNRKGAYHPAITFFHGNHENRIQKFISENPILEGLLEPEGILFLHGVNEVIDYGEYHEIDGLLYTHIPFKGGRPVSSVVNTCGAVIPVVARSVLFGHTHRLEWKQFKRIGDPILQTAMNVGCFIKTVPQYAEASNPHWWSGVLLLHVGEGGRFNFETYDLQRLEEMYVS